MTKVSLVQLTKLVYGRKFIILVIDHTSLAGLAAWFCRKIHITATVATAESTVVVSLATGISVQWLASLAGVSVGQDRKLQMIAAAIPGIDCNLYTAK
jgi:hypothetical protein